MNMPKNRCITDVNLLNLLCAASVVFLSACGPQTTKPATPAQAEIAVNERMALGDYAGAAQEYLRLARLYPEKSRQYQLYAVDAYLSAIDMEQATQLLEKIVIRTDEQLLAFHVSILEAKISLLSGLPDQALQILTRSMPEGVPSTLLAEYYLTRANAYERQSRFLNAATERMKSQQYLAHPAERERNSQQLWFDLNSSKVSSLQELRNSSSGEVAGWVELAIISQTLLFKPDELKLAIAGWAERYSPHPASPVITERILQNSKESEFKPGKIALLLPFSGQFKKASEAIRDGFLAAWLDEDEYHPQIRVYNADSLNITRTYQTAVNDGAELVVGPLEKSAVKALNQQESLPVTTLALNRLDIEDMNASVTGNFSGLTSPALIQFSLSPEDEARQTAQQGIFNGHARALIISPANEWGKRLTTAFRDEWISLGGLVSEQISYDPNSRDFITPVKQLLNIDSSDFRISSLRQKLSRNIKGVSRMREDIDLIFMPAPPLAARQIVPQLRFFRVEGIPIYTTSQAYSGTDSPQANSDMNGVEFTDMPWILTSETQKTSLQNAVDKFLSADSSSYRRLYAFGIDAFKVIPNLKKLTLQRSWSYQGMSGELYMQKRNLIQRKLLWARIVDGKPRLVNFMSVR